MSEQQLAFAQAARRRTRPLRRRRRTVGISAVIAPDGRELARTGFFEPAYLDQQIRLKTAG